MFSIFMIYYYSIIIPDLFIFLNFYIPFNTLIASVLFDISLEANAYLINIEQQYKKTGYTLLCNATH